MNISYRWLRDVAPGIESPPEELARRLAARGAPVEEMTSLGRDLADIRISRVRAVREHPDADRLILCDVEAGEGEVQQVVCGAPNVREGGVYPFAPVGTTLPGGMEIEEAKIRGQRSRGMLCSARELGLGTDHSGILELPEDLEPGAPLVESLGLDDVRLDVEVTPNRGDLLSHLGVARELAPGGDAGLRLSHVPEPATAVFERRTDDREVAGAGARIRIEDPDGCHRYLGAVIRNVEVGPSPPWLSSRLRAAGARPINNVVDATNHVLLEMGQPLHAFDLDRLAEDTIVVRRAKAEETLTTLDGVERELSGEMLCICDARRPVAVAGVMGGEDSEVGAETTDVLLECALFEPAGIRRTRMELDLSTDASYRFERGVDPDAMVAALRRAVELILTTAGGELDPVVLDVNARARTELTVPLRPERVEEVLGVAFDVETLQDLLEPLGFGAEERYGGTLEVTVPGWRSYDVTREIDLIEEVARAHGYDSFPETMEAYRPGSVPDHPLFAVEDDVRDLLVGRGFLEAQVPAFVPEEEGEVALLNPISRDESHLRTTLLPGLLRRVEANFARGRRDVRLFELGTCFSSNGREELPDEETRVGVVATGRRRPPHWSTPGEAVDLWDLKGWLEELVGGARMGDLEVRPGAPEEGLFVAERGFSLVDGTGAVRGRGGRVRTSVVDAPPWADPVWALELGLPAEPAPASVRRFEEPSSFPGVSRDLALIVPDDLPAERVRSAIREVGGPFLVDVALFDLYRGEGIPPETRSLAYRLHFSSPDRTLTDDEVDRAVGSIVDRLEEDPGVEPRG